MSSDVALETLNTVAPELRLEADAQHDEPRQSVSLRLPIDFARH